MNKKLALLLAAGALVAGAQQSQAIAITGGLGFTGAYTSDNLADLSAATTFTISSPAIVNQLVGDFDSTINLGDAVTVTSPIILGGVGAIPVPVNPFWSVGGFSLTLTSLFIRSEDSSSVVLEGFGLLNGPAGFDTTAGELDITFNQTGGIVFNYSATTASTGRVPDGGATAMLLGVGVLGLAGLRRKLS